jgi:hypothetical protein
MDLSSCARRVLCSKKYERNYGTEEDHTLKAQDLGMHLFQETFDILLLHLGEADGDQSEQ